MVVAVIGGPFSRGPRTFCRPQREIGAYLSPKQPVRVAVRRVRNIFGS